MADFRQDILLQLADHDREQILVDLAGHLEKTATVSRGTFDKLLITALAAALARSTAK